MEFKEYKIKEIGEVIGGGTPSTKKEEYYGGNISWITPKDLSNFNSMYISRGERNITEEGLKNSSARVLPYNSILMTSRAPIGYLALAKNEVTTNQGFKSIICNESLVKPKFLYYLLKNEMKRIKSMGTGSTFSEISGKVVKNIEVKLPGLDYQTYIENVLGHIDEKIEINQQIIANLEELSQTLFKHWFVEFEFPDDKGNPYKSSGGEMVDSQVGQIPKDWNIKTINEIVNFINGYAFKSNELLKSNKGNKMLRVFKMGHIKRGGGLKNNATKNYYPKNIDSKLKKYVLKKGDILMSMTDMKNNVAILGNTALMNEDNKYIVNQRVGLLRLKKESYIDFPFLYILTNSSGFLTSLRKKANSGVQVNLTSKSIKEHLVVVPPKSYHMQFNMITKPMYLKIFDLEVENESLTLLRDTLLPKLMSGEIEIPDDIEVNEDELSI